MTVRWTSLCHSRHDSQLRCLFIRHLCDYQLNRWWRLSLFWLFWLRSFFQSHLLWSDSFFSEETFIHINKASNVEVSSSVRCDFLARNERIFFYFLRNSLLFLNFRFLSSNWTIILLKLKFFSEFDRLSWLTKTIIISSINRLNLLILMLCIRSKMYDSKLLLRSRRKRLLSIHDWIVFSMSEHLMTTCLSEFT